MTAQKAFQAEFKWNHTICISRCGLEKGKSSEREIHFRRIQISMNIYSRTEGNEYFYEFMYVRNVMCLPWITSNWIGIATHTPFDTRHLRDFQFVFNLYNSFFKHANDSLSDLFSFQARAIATTSGQSVNNKREENGAFVPFSLPPGCGESSAIRRYI